MFPSSIDFFHTIDEDDEPALVRRSRRYISPEDNVNTASNEERELNEAIQRSIDDVNMQRQQNTNSDINDEENEKELIEAITRSLEEHNKQRPQKSNIIVDDDEQEFDEAIKRSMEDANKSQNNFSIPINNNNRNISPNYYVEEVEDDVPMTINTETSNLPIGNEENQFREALRQSEQQHKIEQERFLREQQEREYAESLKRDQDKERIKNRTRKIKKKRTRNKRN